MKKNTLFILAGVTLAVLFAAFVLKPSVQTKASKQTGEPFLSGLLDRINTIDRISVATVNSQVELKLDAEKKWVLAGKDGYPGNVENARKLLVSSANLKKIEPKTSNPELYSKLGLSTLEDKTSEATLVKLYKGEEIIAQYYLGKRRAGGKDEMYVRKEGDTVSWLVNGFVSVNESPLEWLQKEILDIDAQRIQKVTVEPKQGEPFTVFKTKIEDRNFSLADLPKDKEIDSTFAVNNVANTMAKLMLQDVTKDAAKDPEKNLLYTAHLQTFDGLKVTMQVAKLENKYYAKLNSSFDEAGVNLEMPTPPAPKAADTVETKPAEDKPAQAESGTPADAKATDAQKAAEEKQKAEAQRQKAEMEYQQKLEARKQKIEQAKTAAEQLTKRWQGWVYELSDANATGIGKQKQDFYKKPPEKKPNDPAGKPTGIPPAAE